MTLFNAIKVNTLLYADGRLLRIIFAFIRFFTPKIKNMEDLDSQLLNLIFEKFDIQNDTAEGAIESLMLATLRLERARVAFLALEPDADFIDTASGLVDLADIFIVIITENIAFSYHVIGHLEVAVAGKRVGLSVKIAEEGRWHKCVGR